jgi:hypothetical protein
MSYSPVIVTNSTSFPVSGKVEYVSAFCSTDHFSIAAGPNTFWKASSRGVCLVKEVAVLVDTSPDTVAIAYKSKVGTTHSHFAVIQKVGPSGPVFQVYAISDGSNDAIPADYVAPTSVQK